MADGAARSLGSGWGWGWGSPMEENWECSGLCTPTQKRKPTYPSSPRAGGWGTDDSELLLCVSLETREQSEACLPKLGFTLTSR